MAGMGRQMLKARGSQHAGSLALERWAIHTLMSLVCMAADALRCSVRRKAYIGLQQGSQQGSRLCQLMMEQLLGRKAA